MGKRTTKPERGIWKRKNDVKDPDVRVADFSYESDTLAILIVDAWNNPALKAKLLNHNNQPAVRDELKSRGIFLSHPVVLTEDEYNDGWQQEDEDEVVLVLPNDGRKVAADGAFTLIDTAKLLMAITPNGI